MVAVPPSDPVLAAVVMSFRNEATVVGAVRSLLAQDPPVEVVVSHSGGGPTPALLARECPGVPLVASERRRYPGATRNAGVAATTAPYVSFLAADCLALPGWAAGRIARHVAGERAVASALVPLRRDAPSLAANLLQHSNRMPGYRPLPSLRFGVSYARDALERYGPFPEGPGFPEDVVVNQRLLAAGIPIAWAPDVVSTHDYPGTLRRMVADQHRRGRIHGALHGAWPWRLLLASRVPLEAVVALRRAATGRPPTPARDLVRAGPALALATVAQATGKVRGGGDVDPAAREYVARRRRARLGRVARGGPDRGR
ncbi:glycosyltransferase family 2 protein [Patulibacter sp. SYSU D01012]|uniref:glycosyltransferase family 2 protein n=1 Tax=Patulibacter sp. SYSU D01012 TaxID=2817381 RepID=UPI001B3113E2|nr:glycosyltransferase family 2 protein [Patulibacter sp. SYSU D01012]